MKRLQLLTMIILAPSGYLTHFYVSGIKKTLTTVAFQVCIKAQPSQWNRD